MSNAPGNSVPVNEVLLYISDSAYRGFAQVTIVIPDLIDLCINNAIGV